MWLLKITLYAKNSIELDYYCRKVIVYGKYSNPGYFLNCSRYHFWSGDFIRNFVLSAKCQISGSLTVTNPGLESCPQCLIQLEVTVLRRVNEQQLDTVKCAFVLGYKKVILNNTILTEKNLSSFPCPGMKQHCQLAQNIISLFHILVKEVFEKSVNIGKCINWHSGNIIGLPGNQFNAQPCKIF